MNKVVLIGRLTHDPQGGKTESGKVYARFSLAVSRFGDGADFINVLAWDKTAANVLHYLVKGKQVAVAGRIQTGSYERNGVKYPSFDIVAEQLEFIGNAQNSSQSPASDRNIDSLQEVDEDDDMPF